MLAVAAKMHRPQGRHRVERTRVSRSSGQTRHPASSLFPRDLPGRVELDPRSYLVTHGFRTYILCRLSPCGFPRALCGSAVLKRSSDRLPTARSGTRISSRGWSGENATVRAQCPRFD